MFKSIRWKFIVVYFLLVFIAMVIVMAFIIRKFEDHHLNQATRTMETRVRNLINMSNNISKNDDWNLVKEEIQTDVKQLPVYATEIIYIIDNTSISSIIASNSSNNKIIGQSAFNLSQIQAELIIDAKKHGEKREGYSSIDNGTSRAKHLAYPVLSDNGKIKGIIYVTSDLTDMYNTLEESKTILIKATALALAITVLIGFLIARSITEPINDVTKKAERMAKGDFDQVVEVKSDDEIGQLASMFNYLTLKLKSTLAEVNKEKSKLDTIITHMADGVIAVSLDGKIIHANPVALDMLKVKPEELSEIQYDEIFDEKNNRITIRGISKEEKWRGSEIIEIDSKVYNAEYAPLIDENSNIGGMIIVFQDITKQQKLENMRKEFVANVSHELKTPITTIKSYTETLMDGAIDDKEISMNFLSVIDSECDRMARIVKDLLQLSDLDYKQTKWSKKSIKVNELLKSIYLKIRISAEEKNQKIELNIKEDIGEVLADKDGIEQVILNIITNAIKYTPNNGTIEIGANSDSERVTITVKDNGIGIPKEDINRIFERFYRVDKARSREMGGTGLGLSIAKQIIEAHNGEIRINSECNVGTTVDIILPLK
ncbi:two-component system, OmpR family, sensor histidine kinase VicK [Proteiniborus sp. DW1]|uniref:sensor histidine kinase n=1 Tax=Proteiniborus sp. DW1 TaxID=1889883 RepID=UPI00092DEC8E|nr:ATP-binding protein [Proteiniborus sp. DW1]SCG84465.1 two-component system, OmpR family, sensor histidine kinase VicK [Proteiniborus sp. DW1]